MHKKYSHSTHSLRNESCAAFGIKKTKFVFLLNDAGIRDFFNIQTRKEENEKNTYMKRYYLDDMNKIMSRTCDFVLV